MGVIMSTQPARSAVAYLSPLPSSDRGRRVLATLVALTISTAAFTTLVAQSPAARTQAGPVLTQPLRLGQFSPPAVGGPAANAGLQLRARVSERCMGNAEYSCGLFAFGDQILSQIGRIIAPQASVIHWKETAFASNTFPSAQRVGIGFARGL